MASVWHRIGRVLWSPGSGVAGMRPGVPSLKFFGIPTSGPHDTALVVSAAHKLRNHSQSQIASAETAAEKLTEQTASTETACHRGVDCCCTEEPMILSRGIFPACRNKVSPVNGSNAV